MKQRSQGIIKRGFDIAGGAALLAASLPAFAVISVMIRRESDGPVFFIHRRVGQGGKPIGIYKFRSMRKGSDDLVSSLSSEQLKLYKREYKLDDDPRQIGYKKEGDGEKCFGARLRSSSVDELPQIIFNICLLGNMSVVGPRPILEEELEKNNVTVLKDETVQITDKIYLIGRRDRSMRDRLSMHELTEDLDKDKYMIVLDHQPHDFAAQTESGVDLVLCGHTHGGQMWPVGLLGEWSGANEKTYGLEVRDNTTFIVNSGISDWAIPFKTACIAEFGVIDIVPE